MAKLALYKCILCAGIGLLVVSTVSITTGGIYNDRNDNPVPLIANWTKLDILSVENRYDGRTALQYDEHDGHTIRQYGVIAPGERYAVFGASLHDARSVIYLFDLPLTALAWHRAGFRSIVFIYGDDSLCGEGSQVRYVIETLTSQEFVVLILVSVEETYRVTLSQTSRLFAATIVPNVTDPTAWQNTYIITGDADTWPLNAHAYELPDGKDILHGDISRRAVPDVTKRANVPLSYIGMRVKTWTQVMTQHGKYQMPRNPDHIVDHLKTIFGQDCCRNIKHGKKGWFTDQQLANIVIQQWKENETRGAEMIHIYARRYRGKSWVMTDCVDRDRWRPDNITDMMDAHILTHAYTPENWKLMLPLVKLMYPEKSTLDWCINYTETFRGMKKYC